VAAGVRRGTAKLDGSGRSWSGNAGAVSVFDAKADALAALEACGAPVDRLTVETGAPGWYHPGRSGVIKLGPKTVLGHFGEFHPKCWTCSTPMARSAGFEVFVDAVPEAKAKPTRTKPRSGTVALPGGEARLRLRRRPQDRGGDDYACGARGRQEAHHRRDVFDVFEGKSIGEDKKSVAIEVAIQPLDKTLTDEDFEALAGRIVDNVRKQTGGVLRG
jgi:phenylalanyl-tRNA synthetase beta chain